MRTIIFLISLFISIVVNSQNNEVKLAIKGSYGLYADLLINSPSIALGVNFKKLRDNTYIYFSYNFMRHSLYRGHFLGFAFENHFLSNEKRFRPYFGWSILTEGATNYKEGFLSGDIDNGACFLPRESHGQTWKPYIQGSSAYYWSKFSYFYNSTPFFGTASLGFDVRLIKDLHLSFSLGYGLQIMRYKYLEWKNDADYRELLKSSPMKSKMLHYVNAELGLRYEFSFKRW